MRALLACAVVGVAVIGACGGGKTPPVEGAGKGDASAPAPRLDGEIVRDDKWIKIAPLVGHDAKMDLATRCLLMRDDAKQHGEDIPVCYDTTRKPNRAVTSIVVERDKNMATAMQRLTAAREGVHFVIEHTGGIYQLLDLAYVARHGGAYPEGEVRVVSCNADSEKALVAALQGVYPSATVTTTDLTKEAKP